MGLPVALPLESAGSDAMVIVPFDMHPSSMSGNVHAGTNLVQPLFAPLAKESCRKNKLEGDWLAMIHPSHGGAYAFTFFVKAYIRLQPAQLIFSR